MTAPLHDIEAEAAAWMARLHGHDRSAEDEQSFKRWLASGPLHQASFESMTAAWEAAGCLESDTLARQRRGSPAHRWTPAIAIAAVLAMMAVLAGVFITDGVISTEVGERRDMTLADGSRLTLNTATSLEVEYSDRERRIRLDRGEAFFDVAEQADRPFVVKAAGSEIVALGTAFSVRAEEGCTQVVLLEGKVRVQGATAVVLLPGQRATLRPGAAPTVDEPEVEKVIAWRRGSIAFDRTPLGEAVAEMNRYSRVELVVDPAVAPGIEVSGIFHAGDSRDFARGLARSHGLEIRQESEKIVVRPRG